MTNPDPLIVVDETLKACPNPWCAKVPRDMPVYLKRRGWRVYCDDCRVQAPYGATPSEAVAAWNTRPLPAPPPVDEAGVTQALVKEAEDWLAHLTDVKPPMLNTAAGCLRRIVNALASLRASPAAGVGEVDIGPCAHCDGTGSAATSGQLGMSSDNSKCWWCQGSGRWQASEQVIRDALSSHPAPHPEPTREVVEAAFKEGYLLGFLEGYSCEPRYTLSDLDDEGAPAALKYCDGASEAWSDYSANLAPAKAPAVDVNDDGGAA